MGFQQYGQLGCVEHVVALLVVAEDFFAQRVEFQAQVFAAG